LKRAVFLPLALALAVVSATAEERPLNDQTSLERIRQRVRDANANPNGLKLSGLGAPEGPSQTLAWLLHFAEEVNVTRPMPRDANDALMALLKDVDLEDGPTSGPPQRREMGAQGPAAPKSQSANLVPALQRLRQKLFKKKH
jgi:hypothetical protein